MNGKTIIAAAFIWIAACLTACGTSPDAAVHPLLGLEWFTEYDAAKADMEDYDLLQERESSTEQTAQKMQDYAGVSLYDTVCDLTLCFTDSGLIGLNYHDAGRSRNYREWFSVLEQSYGLPTEQGSGMASWYGNPLGKNTAIYLFNLQEGVQVSFYATADSPDQSYQKQKKTQIPTPELRTQVVPVTEERTTVTALSDDAAETTSDNAGQFREFSRNVLGTDPAGNLVVAVTDDAGAAVTDPVGVTVTTVVSAADVTEKSGTAGSSTTKHAESETVTTQTTAKESAQPDQKRAFLLNGLSFYGTPESARRRMKSYTQRYEYRTAEPGQPWELIMEYENVPYLGRQRDSVLCFTSLGLVGVSYYDEDADSYSDLVNQLTGLYGKPDESQRDYTVWNGDPVGTGTTIYVFAMEDGVQISFFTDDTGSELA